ncbi:hypothetical protein M794_2598 [Acinetobacter baumannii 1605]|nr:hypothetical protein AB57_3893 [Acinetobacter baumannii AB0057]ARG30013.1 hypothetical protein B7L41_01720 [Acinetobacter baumannii]EJO36548.1 hypothetical protein ACINBC5_A0154 [Acinetobacter baumannii Canada BC-5]EPS75356.1 hypothetical protein M794_2598 [Acinetobacter baumannii 1605]OTT17587.1 hypothetical protein CAS84_11315 [Acinetobacter baumannii]
MLIDWQEPDIEKSFCAAFLKISVSVLVYRTPLGYGNQLREQQANEIKSYIVIYYCFSRLPTTTKK